MSVERIKELGRLSVEEIWNKGNTDIIPEVVAPDYVYHQINGQDTKGIEGYKQMVVNMRTAIPDLRYTIDDSIIEGNMTAARLTLTGTFSGKIGDVELKDKKIIIKSAIFSRVEGDKVVEGWGYSDSLSLYQQLGVSPPTS